MDSLGIYSTHHEPCLVVSELMKRQTTQQHANMKPDEHADAQQEWEAPYLGSPAQSGCRVTFTAASLRARGWCPYRTGRHRAANERRHQRVAT